MPNLNQRQSSIEGRASTNEAKRQIIERLYTLWTQWPDLRLGQLIFNIEPYPYYREDEHLLTVLEEGYAAVREGEKA